MMEDKITESLILTPKNVKTFFKSLPKDSIPYINSKISVAHVVIYPEITDADKLKAKEYLEREHPEINFAKVIYSTNNPETLRNIKLPPKFVMKSSTGARMFH